MDKEKKIAVVLGCNIHWAPYYYRYETLLQKEELDFDLIIWNRENIQEECHATHVYEYKERDKSCSNDPKKIVKFFGFSTYVKSVIKKNKYTKIVFLGLQGCAATLNAWFYTHSYKDKYYLDIRDYHYEWFYPYYILEKSIIKNAWYTVISSKGFKRFLPQNDYGYIHNIDPHMDEIVKVAGNIYREEGPIRIGFIGNVRYYNENVKLLEILKNDERFVVEYFGAGSENIQEYCKQNGIHNVKFRGRFQQSETAQLYKEVDIINNIYGNSSMETTTALSNKLYYALCLHKPIIVSDNTYMEKLCDQYGISITFKDDESFADYIYKWYCEFRTNLQDRKDKFDELWTMVMKEDKEAMQRFEDFIVEED